MWFTGVGDVARSASGSGGSGGLETSTFPFSSTPGCVCITADKGWEQEGVWATAPDHRLALGHTAHCPCRVPGAWQSIELPDRLRRSPLGCARGCTCISLSEYRVSLIERAAFGWPRHAMCKYPKSRSIDSSLSCKVRSKIHGCKGEREHFQLRKHPWPRHAPAMILWLSTGANPCWLRPQLGSDRSAPA